MKAEPNLPPQVIEDIARLQSYGWPVGIIGKLIRRKYGITITRAQFNQAKKLIWNQLSKDEQ